MNSVLIEYFLGIYFLVISMSYTSGKVQSDIVKLVAGIVLLVLAILGIGFAK